ncbi:cell wall-binding protein [Desulfosporosinus acidiphilus SJ4]|uniref:Cell wall-binding protein n=1 Tax=Desulfosporosinus acidiphilus (strain DSM 22704 / JCM 16185 / SJ4) TaxID=646529 RepID=I4DBH1_DESAJ|nr:cell wall-binding repeat-containing protein [Desulfosporosinus acidiphilus]AFM43145.1 cell wall-binding protein [Desulfosporosinus acidiphilus SJ4]
MTRIRKAVATFAIATMALTFVPLNVLAANTFPTRIAGDTAAQTAVQIAEQTGWSGTAILASSTSYGMVDALTAGPLAAYLKAPILLTDAGDALNPDTKAELTKLKVTQVYVTSGTGVISQGVLDELTGMGITVVPLGGVDRFATSVNIANKMVELGAKVEKAAVAFGWKNQDALSIASIAAAQTEPILLTEKDSIPASVQEFLANNTSVKSTDVIGGTGVISDEVKDQLPKAARYYGTSAYDTNLAVLKAFDSVLKYDHVFIANGETAIDALAGAPLAAKYKAGIVLTNGEANEGTQYVKTKLNANSVVSALGGTAVVPEGVRSSIVYTAPAGGGGAGGGGGGAVGGGGGGGSNGGGTSTTVYGTANSTIGPTTGTQTVTGNVQITAQGIHLQHMYISGNLEISAAVGDGDVYLDNVTIAGQTTVYGGGEHSIHISNSTLSGTLIVIRQDGHVRIVAAGSTSIASSQVQSGATLENDTGSSTTFGKVTVMTLSGTDKGIDLEGDFTDVTIEAPGVSVTVPSGTVSNLSLGQSAAGSSVNVTGGTVTSLTVSQGVSSPSVSMSSGSIGQLDIQATAQVTIHGGSVNTITVDSSAPSTAISMDSAASVDTMTLNAATGVTGSGAIQNVTVNASGTTIEQSPVSTTVSNSAGSASVGGQSVPGGQTVTTPAPKVTSIISGVTGGSAATVSGTQITIASGAFKEPIISVDQNSTMKITVTRNGTQYNLGSWNLSKSAGNDILSVSNASDLNLIDTLKALKASQITSSQIFSAVNFQALLTAAQGLSTTDKQKVYNALADIMSQGKNTSAANSFYQALNLPGIYAAADVNTQTSISSIIDNALNALPTPTGVTAAQLLSSSTSATAVATLSSSNQMNAFFSNLDFQQLFSVLRTSPNKGAVYTAINFTALFTSVDSLPSANKDLVYLDCAVIYQVALSTNLSNTIDYGALLELVMTSPNTVTLSLSNANQTTTTYTVVKS